MKEKGRIFKILIYFLVAVIFLTLPAGEVQAQGATHTVCASDCDFTSIQAAIDAAAPGDTIEVEAGTYDENLTVDKSIDLIGAGRDVTTVQGVSPTTDTGMLNIASSDVTIDGFEFLGVGNKTVRITQPVGNVNFVNNRVVGAENTLSLTGWSVFESNYNMDQTNLVISNNIFVADNSATLLYLNPDLINLTLTGNTFEGTMMPGGLVTGFDGLDGNQDISGNTFDIESTYALLEAFGTFDIIEIFDANTWPAGYIATGRMVAPTSVVYPSTNDINRTNGWAHVNKISGDLVASTIALEFVQTRSFPSCFEYRTDGDTSQKIGEENFNDEILDGLYPYKCLSTISTQTETFDVNEYIEVRLSFGSEKDERFYWTRFELVDELWVCESGDCGHPGYEFDSLQGAIDAADNGATIHILAGEYVETGQIIIDKDLSILGEDKATTIIKPAQDTGSSGDSRGWFLVEDGVEFNLSGVTLDGDGYNIHQAIRSFGSGTVENNLIKNIIYPTYYGTGIVVMGDYNMVLNNNIFSNIGRIGMMAYGTGVTDTTIADNTYVGKGEGDWLDYGIEIGGGAKATITGNTISDCLGVASSDGSASAGILVTDFYGPGTEAIINNNKISNSIMGIGVGYDETDTSVVSATNNTFEDNEYHIDAENETNIDIADALLQNNYDKAVTIEGGYTIYGTLQGAIDDAEADDTLTVQDGIYIEELTIDKPLHIIGQGEDTIVQSPDEIEQLFGSSSHPIVLIQDTDDVTIENLVVDGAGKGNANHKFVGVAFWNAGGSLEGLTLENIIDTPFSGTQHGVAVSAYNTDGVTREISLQNNTFVDFQKNAIALNANETTRLIVDIQGNTITGAGTTSVTAQNGIQVWAAQAEGTIANNTVSGIGYDGSEYVGSSILVIGSAFGDMLIDNNAIYNAQMGIYLWDGSAVISNNHIEIEKIGDFSYGIIASDPPTVPPQPYGEEGLTVSSQTADSRAILPVAIKDNNIMLTGTDITDTWGILAEGGYTLYDLDLTITGNIITGFDYGVEIYQAEESTGEIINVDANQNCIVESSSYGMLSNAETIQINAINNFWGDASGPYHPTLNEGGEGGQVSDGIDFEPWWLYCEYQEPEYQYYMPLILSP